MSWNPREPDPRHPIQDSGFVVGHLSDEAGEPVGCVMLMPLVFWSRVSGHLWWRRWGDPSQVVDAFATLKGEFETPTYYGPAVDRLVDDIRGNRWCDDKHPNPTYYKVEWLGLEESADVAEAEWGVDIALERAQRALPRT